MKLSARNQLEGRVTGITEGPATTIVHLDLRGQQLVASITTEAAQELGLAEGMDVVAVIKASDVMVATRD